MIGSFDFTPQSIKIVTASGEVCLEAGSLYDAAPCHFDPVSGQRLGKSFDGLESPHIRSVVAHLEGVLVGFEDEAPINYRLSDIEAIGFARPYDIRPLLWQAKDAHALAMHDYDAVMGEGEALRLMLKQVALSGFAQLKGAPSKAGLLEEFVARFSHIHETNYGRVFDVKQKPKCDNLADSTLSLELHTDNPYRDHPPQLQILHVLESAQIGGETLLADGFNAASVFSQSNPDLFDLLCRVKVRFCWSDDAHYFWACAPIITQDHTRSVSMVRFNHRAMIAADAKDDETLKAWRQAYRAFGRLLNEQQQMFKLTLNSGDILIMDNHRILHGRGQFEQSQTSARHLQGAYAHREGLLSRLHTLSEQKARDIVAHYEELYASEALDDHYGEDLTIRNHMLQTADCARASPAPPELIAAGLLHDIGWLQSEKAHEQTGSDKLAQDFGPSVSEPVRLHVLAKRYLVAKDPDYASKLSHASKATLVHQGGPLEREKWQEFEHNPYFKAALSLRFCDDEAKNPQTQATDFKTYKPLLEHLALNHLMK